MSNKEVEYDSEAVGIVVDSRGNIYVGNTVHNAINVYDSHGLFLHSINTNTKGTHLAFSIDEFDNLYVTSAHSYIVKVYNLEGCIIKQIEDDNGIYYDQYFRNNKEFIASDGTIYKLDNPIFKGQYVIRIVDEKSTTIVELPTNNSWTIFIPLSLLFIVLIIKISGGLKKRNN